MNRFLLALAIAVPAFAPSVACSDGSAESSSAATVTDAGPSVDAREASTTSTNSESDAGTSDARAVDAAVGDAATDVAVDAKPKGPFACTRDTSFPSTFSIPEASAAAEVELIAGVRELLVVSDSGNGGVALAISLATGATRNLTLSLDSNANDDIEGIAWRDGHLYTLTSSGAARRFTPDGQGGLVRDQDAYAIGPQPYACADLGAVNCGNNYEGLCLRAAAVSHPCAGYAASRADGKLYCLTLDDSGKLAASTQVAPLALAIAADRLSDCAFGSANGGASEALVVTSNVYNLSRSYRVNETSGALAPLPAASLLNNEAIAIDGDGKLYVFSDSSSAISAASRDECQNW